MLTLDRTAQSLALREQRSMRPTFIAGLLFACMEIVPLTANTPFTPLRGVGIGLLLVMAIALVRSGLPGTRTLALPRAATGAAPVSVAFEGESLPPLYRALLVFADGSRAAVLESGDPARVLDDAAFLSRSLQLSLGNAWGLEPHSLLDLTRPISQEQPLSAAASAYVGVHTPLPGQRAAAYTTLWASGFVLIASFVMSDGPERHGLVPSVLSVTLPCLAGLVLLGMALWMLGLREELSVTGAGYTRRRTWFGLALGSPVVREARVGLSALVTPADGAAGHLLLATDRGLVAVTAESKEGTRWLGRHPSPSIAPGRAAE
jgi:hypothetical protein